VTCYLVEVVVVVAAVAELLLKLAEMLLKLAEMLTFELSVRLLMMLLLPYLLIV
jgi:hypothetical protein